MPQTGRMKKATAKKATQQITTPHTPPPHSRPPRAREVGREFASPRADLNLRIPAGESCRFYGGEGPKLQSDNENIFTDLLANRR
jgi:hypothetical protein